ncbi:MAG: hypothetical protein V1883_02825 [Candidatus Omnitrophota bacterium]
MKNIKFIFLALLIASSAVFLYTQDALAAFSINLNFYSIDFGNLNMGDIKDDVPGIGLTVTCQTDQGNPWQLRIRAERPLTSILNPSSFIPNTNFFWYGISSSVPGNNSLVRNQEDFTVERTVYSAPGTEGNPGTDITLKFKVIVPRPVQSGIYNTKIVFTFTE